MNPRPALDGAARQKQTEAPYAGLTLTSKVGTGTINTRYPPVTHGRYDGTVVLHVVVGKNGAVDSARYVSGRNTLANSAVTPVLQWRYKPTLMNGVPVEVVTTVSVVFSPFEKEEPPVANK